MVNGHIDIADTSNDNLSLPNNRNLLNSINSNDIRHSSSYVMTSKGIDMAKHPDVGH